MRTKEFKRRSTGDYDYVSWSGENNEKLKSLSEEVDDNHDNGNDVDDSEENDDIYGTVEYGEYVTLNTYVLYL